MTPPLKYSGLAAATSNTPRTLSAAHSSESPTVATKPVMQEQISAKDDDSYSDNWHELFPPTFCLKAVVHVFVGTETEPNIIHKDKLCASSDFFKKACQEPWKESHGVIELQATNPRLFDIYAQWLYSPGIFASMPKPMLVTAADGAVSVPAYEPLFHLYALGDMLQDSKFKNAVLDEIVKVSHLVNYYPICFAAFVYSELPPSSPLRRLYVDFWVGSSHASWFTTKNPADDCNSSDAPMEFFRDVLKKSKSGESGKKPWNEDICQYHEHPKGASRCQAL